MREYGKIAPTFWTGHTGRQIKKMGAQAQVIALYLLTSPHANMLGLYYLPLPYIAHETGSTLQGASKALQSLSEVSFCTYDEEPEMVFVHEMAKYQIGEDLKPNDKRVIGIERELAKLPKTKLIQLFIDRYSVPFHIDTDAHDFKGLARGFQGPPKPGAGAGAGSGAGAGAGFLPGDIADDSGQTEKDGHEIPEQIFIRLPTNTGEEYPVTESQIAKWKTIYGNVDIEQELKRMLGWLDAREANQRKTMKGMKKFIDSWISREQNKARTSPKPSNGNGSCDKNAARRKAWDALPVDMKQLYAKQYAEILNESEINSYLQ